jgi:hypothetical protein
MEEILVCENGVMRPANEAELEQMRIDAEQAQARLPDEIRQQRNQLLTASDWTQIPDCTVDKQAWATYRQALRDITTQAGFPSDVVFPTKPQV